MTHAGLRLAAFAGLALLAATPARAQTEGPRARTTADSLAARADTLAADSLRRVARLDADRARLRRRPPPPLPDDDAPARSPFLTLADVVADAPGAFLYRSDALGFPAALSTGGAPPEATGLRWGPFGLESAVTGAARFDLVPLAWTETPRAGPDVRAALRPFSAPRPITDVRYSAGGTVQGVEAVHAQARARRLLGADGVVRVAAGYAGRAASGEYPNQRLAKGRTLLGSAAFRAERWSADALVVHARGTAGASGGVLPAVGGTIYDRFTATVRDADARRRTRRTDAALVLARGSGVLTLFGARETLLYRTTGRDTLAARVDRAGADARLPLGFGARGPVLDARAHAERTSGALPAVTSGRAEATLADTLGPLGLRAGAVLDGKSGPRAVARVRFAERVGGLRVTAEAGQHVGPASAVRRHGFGGYVGAAGDPPVTRDARIGGDVGVGAWTFGATAFVADDAVSTWAGAPGQDTLGPGARYAARRAGVLARAGWRADAARGLYGTGWALAQRRTGEAALAGSLPGAYGDGRVGVRAALFGGDLVVDAFGRARAWSGFRGRVLHEPTGLLVLAADGVAPVPAGATLDFTVTARVRTATLYLAYENALSGSPVLDGNALVPDYPLAARRLRFGVFWPILD